MSKRVEAFFSMGIVSVFKIGLSLIRNKLMAVILGTVGIGAISIINNIIGLIQPIGNLGINTGIVKKISDDIEDEKQIHTVITTSYFITTVISFLVILAMIIFSKDLSLYNLGDKKYYKYIILISFSMPFTTFNSIDTSIINGFREIKAISIVAIVSSIVNIIVSIPLIYLFKFDGAVVSILVMAILNYIINFVVLKRVLVKHNLKLEIQKYNYSNKMLKILITFGTTSICAIIFANLSMLLIKNAITNKLGMEYNGIFQAVWAIMNQYIGILFSSCSVYYFPTLCILKTSKEKTKEINKTLEMLLIVIVPLFILIMCFKDIVILLLYDKTFIAAADLLSIFIIGDFFKVISWTIGFVFAPINKIRDFIIIDFLGNTIYTAAAIILTYSLGSLYGIAYSYIGINVLTAVIYYFYLNRAMDFKFDKSTVKNMILSFAVLSIVYAIIMLVKITIVRYLAPFLILLIWFKFVVDDEQKNKVKNLILSKIRRENIS